jgi:hypothetical protein
MWRGRDPVRNLELVATHDESTIPDLQMLGYMAFDSHGHFDVVKGGNPRSWRRTGTGGHTQVGQAGHEAWAFWTSWAAPPTRGVRWAAPTSPPTGPCTSSSPPASGSSTSPRAICLSHWRGR